MFTHPVVLGDVKKNFIKIQDGARNVIPLIVHVTHFYYYKKNI